MPAHLYTLNNPPPPELIGPPSPDSGYVPALEYAAVHEISRNKMRAAIKDGLAISKSLWEWSKVRKAWEKRDYVFKLPPEEHPDWGKKTEIKFRKTPRPASKRVFDQKWDDRMARFLAAFIKNAPPEANTFSQRDLARYLSYEGYKTSSKLIIRFASEHIPGFGTLPRVPVEVEHHGRYSGNKREFYYSRHHIVKFLRGEYREGVSKNAPVTIDELVAPRDAEQVVAEAGFYFYDRARVYAASFDGFMAWVDDNVRRKNPLTGEYVKHTPNEKQLEFYRNAFALREDGRFRYQTICISRPRGDYKSFDTALLVAFRFFNLPEEKIFLLSSSKAQSGYLLLNTVKEIIRNSPTLNATAGLDIQTDDIFLKKSQKESYATITSATTASGLFSNASCIALTELSELKDETFFAKASGSLRGGEGIRWLICESTVAVQGHVFERMWRAYEAGADPLLYFQWYGDEWYGSSAAERKSYLLKNGELAYAEYYRNVWGLTGGAFFSRQMIYRMNVLSYEQYKDPHPKVGEAVDQLFELRDKLALMKRAGTDYAKYEAQIKAMEADMVFVEDLYTIPASAKALDDICAQFGPVSPLIGMGLDRAQPRSANKNRTVSMTGCRIPLSETEDMVFMLDVHIPQDDSLQDFAGRVTLNNTRYSLIDTLSLEAYQSADCERWCLDNGFDAEIVTPNAAKKDEMFGKLYSLLAAGQFKCPPVPLWEDGEDRVFWDYPPHDKEDLVRREMAVFEKRQLLGTTNATRNVYGAPGKNRLGQASDDCMSAKGLMIRALFRDGVGAGGFSGGAMSPEATVMLNENVYGDYGTGKAAAARTPAW